ncbi:MAG TPA: glycosyltransferase family A protein, partial [Novosphingobium sp.]|nr:glycosyltransferase family A protein [Novosphingobium sp.]
MPPVTVVMPVYNALPYLDEAVESILGQSYSAFEFAIYDDHSTDGSYERALEWARRDPRIRVARGERRLGPSASSNAAAAMARSEFVARMDADDIAVPDRLARQLAVLQADPGAALTGSIFDLIDSDGNCFSRAPGRRSRGAGPPIAHASLFYRRAAFEAAGGYRPNTDYFEDIDLYRRMARHGAVVVIDRPLLKLRFAGQHARLRDDREQVVESINLHYRSAGSARPGPRNLSPVAFYSVAVLAALGLQRPALLGLMARRAHFDRPHLTLAILGFVALAELSPAFARGLNQLLLRLRARTARAQTG